MTSDKSTQPTQDEPIMDGATEATADEKREGREEQRQADAATDSAQQ